MAEVERRRVDLPVPAQTGSELENLPTLFGKLGDDVMRLVDTKLSLVKVELKEDASFYARNGAFTAVGAMVALIGFALVNVAIAFFISNFFANDGMPCAVIVRSDAYFANLMAYSAASLIIR